MSSTATNGWSVNNVMRAFGVNTKTAVHTAWQAGKDPPRTTTTFDISRVQQGIDFLVSAGLATYNSGTGVITPTSVGSDGKPARLRRVAGHDDRLELLPPGATPQDGS